MLYWEGHGVQVHQGDAREVLRTMEPESIQCVMTSPPYWGLRDYGLPPTIWGGVDGCEHKWGKLLPKAGKVQHGQGGSTLTGGHSSWGNRDGGHQGQYCSLCGAWRGTLGLEPTPQLYVQHLTEIMREVWRVLRKDGTIFLNLGDSYAQAKGHGHWESQNGKGDEQGQKLTKLWAKRGAEDIGLKPKDLIGVPWRVAFALQEDGWYLRSDIIWAKNNPLPESVTDRPTRSHEYIFMLTKDRKYYYDAEVVKEPLSAKTLPETSGKYTGQATKDYASVGAQNPSDTKRRIMASLDVTRGRNRRTVWQIPTQPYKGAHFAVFPERLVTPCLMAGTSEKGCCPECGAPQKRMVERIPGVSKGCPKTTAAHEARGGTGTPVGTVGKSDSGRTDGISTTVGWQPTCSCNPGQGGTYTSVPCVILDPFAGSGTVGVVARKLGRKAILIDSSLEYCGLMKERVERG